MVVTGYARVSTHGQSTEVQEKQLRDAGCEKVFTDTISGVASHRPGLEACLEYMREGDTLVIPALDRLGRSLKDLLQIVTDLDERGIQLRSLRETIDSSTSIGRLFFHLMAALAEFERELIKERIQRGIEEARAKGRKGGRPWLVTPEQMQEIRRLYDERDERGLTVTAIARLFNTTPTTVYRVLEKVPHA